MDLSPGRPSTDQNDIGSQTFDLALDVVHPSERENLMTVKADQVCKRPSLGVHLPERQRSVHTRWSSFGAEIVLMIEGAVNAGNDSDGESAELVIFAAPHRDQLSFGHAIGPHHVLGALR